MIIEINPRSLLNLEHICEVLYKLYPSVLDDLVDMERSLGEILGTIDLNNVSLKEREFLANNAKEVDYSSEPKKVVKVTKHSFINKKDAMKFVDEYKSKNPNVKVIKEVDEEKDKSNNPNIKVIKEDEYKSNNPNVKILNKVDKEEDEEFKRKLNKFENKYFDEEHENSCRFHELRKYIQLDTDEYIPMKISVKVEDPVIGKKVKELVRALVKTRAPEQFYLHKKEVDEDAYFAEGYGLTMNEEQKKRFNDFFWGEDVKGLEELLEKENLYP